MRQIHILLSLVSLSVILVTLERFSFTTKILLQPYNYLRLHELVQMAVIILITVILPLFILKIVTHDFSLLRDRKGVWLLVLFITGIYFYSTGNGVHELASFFYNSYCNTKVIGSGICAGMFFNDYYFGNIVYFIGGFFMVLVPLIFERMKPRFNMSSKDTVYIILNALVYTLAVVAYAAFDRVSVGLIYTLITMIVVDILLFTRLRVWKKLPLTFYTSVVYTLGGIIALILRLR